MKNISKIKKNAAIQISLSSFMVMNAISSFAEENSYSSILVVMNNWWFSAYNYCAATGNGSSLFGITFQIYEECIW